jgi:hypothetical protein
MPGEIPDAYLDMVMTCPFPKGQAEGPKVIRDVLASEVGPKIRPLIVSNIQNAKNLVELVTGAGGSISEEEAAITAFGGAIVTDEKGRIVREPEPEPEPERQAAETADQPQPELQGAAEKK